MNCSICNELKGKVPYTFNTEYDEIVRNKKNILYETDNFMLIPSIGALNNSHLLIVPKIHVNSIALLSQEQLKECFLIIEYLQSFYYTNYKKELVFFESGTGKYINNAGSCIVHAHIHVLESVENFENLLFDKLKMKKINSNTIKKNADVKLGYALYINTKKECYLANRPSIPSQFVRTTYAKCLNTDIEWDWRNSKNLNNIRETIINYKNL